MGGLDGRPKSREEEDCAPAKTQNYTLRVSQTEESSASTLEPFDQIERIRNQPCSYIGDYCEPLPRRDLENRILPQSEESGKSIIPQLSFNSLL